MAKSLKSDLDISVLYKKAEDASKSKLPSRSHARNSANAKSDISLTVANVHCQEESYSEAQALLSDWMTSKLMDFDVNDSTSNFDITTSPCETRKEWDHLSDIPSLGSGGKYSEDASLEHVDVNKYIQSLLEKDYTKYNKSSFDDVDAAPINPQVKMELRHQKVKERKEKRQRALEEKRRRDLDLKETMLQAKKLIAEEERQKLLLKRREEELIQQEMTSIRKQFAEQRKQDSQRHMQELEEMKKVTRMQELAELESQRKQSLEFEKARNLEIKRELFFARMERKKITASTALLSNCFHAWFRMTAHGRIACGRAKAFFDFKLQGKVFRAWRCYTQNQVLLRQSERIQREIKEEQKLFNWASNFHKQKIMKVVFNAWLHFIHLQRLEKEESEKKHQLQRKMNQFLDEASKKIQTLDNGEKQDVPDDIETSSHLNKSVAEKSTHLSKHPRGEDEINPKKGPSLPKEPWQVTKDVLTLDLQSLTDDSPVVSAREQKAKATGYQASTRSGNTVRIVAKPVVNQFEHRHKAQQELLKEQAKQLAEQRRMIEDLQSITRQQQLQAQLHFTAPVTDFQSLPVPPESPAQENPPLLSLADGTKEDETQRSVVQSSRVPKKDQFLTRMQARTQERARQKAEREERKRREEEERLKQAEKEAEELLQREKEQKRQRILERQLKEKQRQAQMEVVRQQDEKVENANRTRLLKFYGLIPWKRLIASRLQNERQAHEFFSKTTLRRCLLAWHITISETLRCNRELADQHYEKLLTRRYFTQWTMVQFQMDLLEARALEFSRFKRLSRHFYSWLALTKEARLAARQAQLNAEDHDRLRVMKRCFFSWRRLPDVTRAEKERQSRLNDWRQKVRSFLPDYDVEPAGSASVESSQIAESPVTSGYDFHS